MDKPAQGLKSKPLNQQKNLSDDFFCQPIDIADEVFHIAHQPRSAWSFDVEIRPFGETWSSGFQGGQQLYIWVRRSRPPLHLFLQHGAQTITLVSIAISSAFQRDCLFCLARGCGDGCVQ